MSRQITLTRGYTTTVDDEDYERLSKFKWHVTKSTGGTKWYAQTRIYIKVNGRAKGKNFKMHRMILGLEDSKIKVDHINHDTLFNCKINLRVCTDAENGRNLPTRKTNKSGYRGVWLKKNYPGNTRRKRWVASIKINYKVKIIGYFLTKEEAALAYNEASKKYFGEFGVLNNV